MPEYNELTLAQMVDLAKNSSSEIGALGTTIYDYETGISGQCADEETAMFLASARGIVLELCWRIQQNSK